MLNTDENYVIGIDVGAKEASAVLADIGLNMTKRFKAQETDPAAFIGEITKKSSLAAGKIKAVGMGVSSAEPGRIASDMKKKTGMAVFAESKSVCAAIGEKCLNKELDDGAVLYMYSDAGSGVIMKDRTFTEENRYLKPWPEHIGIRAAAKRGVAKGVGTAIVDFANGDIENITEETVIKAALAKDEVALDIVQSAGLNLGVRIAYLVNLFGPKTIVIGGGTEKAGELILGPMMRTVRRFALNERKTRVNIIPCSLGNEAVSVGAAAVAVREIFLTA
jgi:predicted NBD/HSP70 family sugar kinase